MLCYIGAVEDWLENWRLFDNIECGTSVSKRGSRWRQSVRWFGALAEQATSARRKEKQTEENMTTNSLRRAVVSVFIYGEELAGTSPILLVRSFNESVEETSYYRAASVIV